MTDVSILKFFADYIESQVGIVYTDINYFQLDHRLQDIAHQLGMKDVQELYGKAKVSIESSFKNLLLDLATNNETSFYRDAHVFTAIEKMMLPELLRLYPHMNEVHIWSAASSSGQELYTIMMEFYRLKKLNSSTPSPRILASDISETILKRAQAGMYSQLEVQRGLPARMLVENFEQINDNQWKVKPHLQNQVEFRKLNLLDSFSTIGPFHIIYCRNVLIYQSIENKTRVLDKIYDLLVPGGYLVLGAAESIFGLSNKFELISDEKTILYRKSEKGTPK